jgi:hypothetical protein
MAIFQLVMFGVLGYAACKMFTEHLENKASDALTAELLEESILEKNQRIIELGLEVAELREGK